MTGGHSGAAAERNGSSFRSDFDFVVVAQSVTQGTLMQEQRKQNPAKALRIASRSKRVDGVIHEPVVVVLRHSDLEKHFTSPLHVAAKLLGVCTTALKW